MGGSWCDGSYNHLSSTTTSAPHHHHLSTSTPSPQHLNIITLAPQHHPALRPIQLCRTPRTLFASTVGSLSFPPWASAWELCASSITSPGRLTPPPAR